MMDNNMKEGWDWEFGNNPHLTTVSSPDLNILLATKRWNGHTTNSSTNFTKNL